MELVLKVVEGPSDGEWRGLEARFDAAGGLIGRAETARLSLPDSTRTVSRFHAHVSFSDGSYFLEEMGSRNTATINGKALAIGERAALRPGDQVRLGHFTLAVNFDDPDFPATQVLERAVPESGAAEDPGTRVLLRASSAKVGDAGASALWEAFLDGAGVTMSLPPGDRPEMMRSVGLMLRSLLGGVHKLTTQRVRLREEAGPDKARPQSRQLDPVRQAAEEARLIASILQPAGAGAAQPLTRIQELMEDLAAQVAAMRTAVNAAVEQTEAKLTPAAVEEKLETSLLLDEILPMRRKARLWDLYRHTHSTAMGEQNSDKNGSVAAPAGNGKTPTQAGVVREAFNRAFSRAYEAEVARLRKDRH